LGGMGNNLNSVLSFLESYRPLLSPPRYHR